MGDTTEELEIGAAADMYGCPKYEPGGATEWNGAIECAGIEKNGTCGAKDGIPMGTIGFGAGRATIEGIAGTGWIVVTVGKVIGVIGIGSGS